MNFLVYQISEVLACCKPRFVSNFLTFEILFLWTIIQETKGFLFIFVNLLSAKVFEIRFDNVLQLNLHETDLLFRYFWELPAKNCSETITKTILHSYAANFLQICVNLQKYWNNAMSNDGLIIENMDLSHIHLAVHMLGKLL